MIALSEIYTPSTATWSATGSMNRNRQYHTMTLLANGNQVLVVGGEGLGSSPNTFELHHINSGTWTLSSSNVFDRRILHTSILLNNGRVLIAGGIIDNAQAALYFDPTSSTWVRTGPMISNYHESPTATLLADGRVLITGGGTSLKVAKNTAEIYDPTTNTWRQTSANMLTGRYYHAAVRLLDGNVLIVGGFNGSNLPTSAAELYIPSSDSFVSVANPTYGGLLMTLTILSNDFVLSTSGGDTQSNCPVLSEVYNPSTRTWMKTAFLNIERESNRTFTCDGDNTAGMLNSCEFFSFT